MRDDGVAGGKPSGLIEDVDRQVRAKALQRGLRVGLRADLPCLRRPRLRRSVEREAVFERDRRNLQRAYGS
jgi:hypothetical protein